MAQIHPTAILHPTARLAPCVEVGPYAIIGEDVVLGEGCRVEAHAQILARCTLGTRNHVGHGAVLGGDPQSLAFDPRLPSGVNIGSGNTFREHVTVHRSMYEGHETMIGNDNFLMAGAHVGHDSAVGNSNVIANTVLLGGHVTVGSRCFLGGGSVYHQFVRVGDFAMTQGNSGFSQDLPPCCTGADINRLVGLNVVGMRRAGMDGEERLALKRAFAAVMRGNSPPQTAARNALDSADWPPAARGFLEFMLASSKKGVCRWRSRKDGGAQTD